MKNEAAAGRLSPPGSTEVYALDLGAFWGFYNRRTRFVCSSSQPE